MVHHEHNNGGFMYRLRDLKTGIYQIHSKTGKAFEGTLTAIKTQAVGMGIKSQEFDIAIFELEYHDHDYADFGILGWFIMTGKDSKAA